MTEKAWNWREEESNRLAYLGDAVYELALRRHLLERSKARGDQLQRQATYYVSAPAQAELLHRLQAEGFFTEEEWQFLKYVRNRRPGTVARHCRPADYRWATALEAYCGRLYMEGNSGRLETFFAALFRLGEEERQRRLAETEARRDGSS